MQTAKKAAAGLAVAAAIAVQATAAAAGPDHPVITEVFQDPPGNDGPAGHDPANPHQQYLEIYLPPAADLAGGALARKDSLKLTFYEIEGDASSSGNGTVNYRIDLPPFDLDPANGITPGAIARPSSGVVVIGWVDVVGNPPTALAGTATTRIGLVNGGITSASGYTFVALNGSTFGGTLNFPVPVAISGYTVATESASGIIEGGSQVYLLVDRDAVGYAQVDAAGGMDLWTGTPLAPSALYDAYAGNDDAKFVVADQPCALPAGIDLQLLLACGGAFTNLVPQLPEDLQGYARRFVDDVKTTESLAVDDPALDALLYRTMAALGPIAPTPGVAHFAADPAELGLAADLLQSFDVLTGTTGRPGILAANVGGNRAMTSWPRTWAATAP
jgi:hypothetical protein